MDMDRPILAPPGTPPAMVAALRKAFHEAMADPGLIADANKANIDFEEVTGEKVATIIDRRLRHAAGCDQGRQRGDEPDRREAGRLAGRE